MSIVVPLFIKIPIELSFQTNLMIESSSQKKIKLRIDPSEKFLRSKNALVGFGTFKEIPIVVKRMLLDTFSPSYLEQKIGENHVQEQEAYEEINRLKTDDNGGGNIVNYLFSRVHTKSLFVDFVFERAKYKDLMFIVSSFQENHHQKLFSACFILSIIRQLFQGLAFLHDVVEICHLDLALENIFVDTNGVIKIGDLGRSRWLRDCQITSGREEFCPPEASPRKIQPGDGTKVDIWAAGCLIVMLSGFITLPVQTISICDEHGKWSLGKLSFFDFRYFQTFHPQSAEMLETNHIPFGHGAFIYLARRDLPSEIIAMVNSMTNQNPIERPSISSLLHDYDFVRTAELNEENFNSYIIGTNDEEGPPPPPPDDESLNDNMIMEL